MKNKAKVKTKFAVIQHNRKQVNVFKRKMDATFFHVKFHNGQHVQFKEFTNIKQLPKNYTLIEV